MDEIPYCYRDPEWRYKKWLQLCAVLYALDELSFGSMYTPAYTQVRQARELLEKAQNLMSEENWRDNETATP